MISSLNRIPKPIMRISFCGTRIQSIPYDAPSHPGVRPSPSFDEWVVRFHSTLPLIQPTRQSKVFPVPAPLTLSRAHPLSLTRDARTVDALIKPPFANASSTIRRAPSPGSLSLVVVNVPALTAPDIDHCASLSSFSACRPMHSFTFVRLLSEVAGIIV